MCVAAGFTPRIIAEADPMSTVIGLVASSAGIAIVPMSMHRLKIMNVVYKKLSGTNALSEFRLVWRRDDDSSILQNFLSIDRSKLTEMKFIASATSLV
jgi:DNA-binding transcriptional LysR family regulator